MAVPSDIDDSRLEKAGGVIELPLHVSWSGPRIQWDLADRRQRARVYEIVLSEGTADDVRRFIDVDQLVDLWDDLWLAPHVRHAWAETSSASATSVWRAEQLPAGGGPASGGRSRSRGLRSGWRSRAHRDWNRRARDR